MKLKSKSQRGGFTLIELLVVLAIISLLSSVVLASLKDAREKAKMSAFRQEINQLIKALELYKIEYGRYPLQEVTISGASGIYQNGSEWSFPGPPQYRLSNYLVSRFIPRMPNIINPNSSNTTLFTYRKNSGTASNPNWHYKCKDDTQIPPYVLLMFNPTDSNLRPNYDAVSDWQQGYYSYNPIQSSLVTSSRCFSLK